MNIHVITYKSEAQESRQTNEHKELLHILCHRVKIRVNALVKSSNAGNFIYLAILSYLDLMLRLLN